jgi:hypothetical protein
MNSVKDNVEPTLASVIGDSILIPPIKGKMLRKWIELEDGSLLWLRLSRKIVGPRTSMIDDDEEA